MEGNFPTYEEFMMLGLAEGMGQEMQALLQAQAAGMSNHGHLMAGGPPQMMPMDQSYLNQFYMTHGMPMSMTIPHLPTNPGQLPFPYSVPEQFMYNPATATSFNSYQQSVNPAQPSESAQDSKKSKKRRVVAANIGIPSIDEQKNTTENAYKMFKALFSSDIRRAYPKLIEDALNTVNLDHLQRVITLMCDDDCRRVQGRLYQDEKSHTVCLGPVQREINGPEEIFKFMVAIANSIPDGLYQITDCKIRHFAHTPESLDKIPLDYFDESKSKELDRMLLDKAKAEGVAPNSGFCMIGRFAFTGTQVFELKVPQEQPDLMSLYSPSFNSAATSRFSPNIELSGLFIWHLLPNNKISRWETYSEGDYAPLISTTLTYPAANNIVA